MLEIKKTVIQANVYGTVYELCRPSTKLAKEYGKLSKEQDEDNGIDLVIDLVDKCGLPKAVAEEMEVDHLLQIVDALLPAKKK